MIHGHGGNIYTAAKQLGCSPNDIFDMSSNVNPMGPPPGLVPYLRESLESITALPQVDAQEVVNAFSAWHNIDPRGVMAGNGSTQLIYSLPLALNTRKALILGPTYADYADACNMHRIDYEVLIAPESERFKIDIHRFQRRAKRFDTVFICNPNNPTGTLVPAADLKALCRSCPDTFFIIDESYLPFVDDPHTASMLKAGLSNVMVLNSMSKIFRIPGLRIGFLITSPAIVQRMSRYGLPWSVNSLAQAAVLYLSAHRDQVETFNKQTRQYIKGEKKRLTQRLQGSPHIKLFASHTPFILAKLLAPLSADAVCQYVLKHRILVRNTSNFEGLSDAFLRFSLKSPEINTRLTDILLRFFSFELTSRRRSAIFAPDPEGGAQSTTQSTNISIGQQNPRGGKP